jgi:hypothetical protein
MKIIESITQDRSLPWLFIDIDSTLVIPGTELSGRNRAALAAYIRAGGRISLASGKHPRAVEDLARGVDLPGPHIAGNGAVVIENGEYHLLHGIAPWGPELDQFLLAEGIPFCCYTRCGMFIHSPVVQAMHIDLLLAIGEPVRDLTQAPDWENAFKILMFIPESETEVEASLKRKAAEVGVACVRTSNEFLEFISVSSGKDVAMARILQDAGWPVSQTAAIGDSENDLSLLLQAGVAAVVANAPAQVKEIADTILPSCAEDGVAAYIELLLG